MNYFAKDDEPVCNNPGPAVDNDDGTQRVVFCRRVLGHEGDHAGTLNRDLRKEHEEKQLWLRREVERLQAESIRPAP